MIDHTSAGESIEELTSDCFATPRNAVFSACWPRCRCGRSSAQCCWLFVPPGFGTESRRTGRNDRHRQSADHYYFQHPDLGADKPDARLSSHMWATGTKAMLNISALFWSGVCVNHFNGSTHTGSSLAGRLTWVLTGYWTQWSAVVRRGHHVGWCRTAAFVFPL